MTDTATTTTAPDAAGSGPDLYWFDGVLMKVHVRAEQTGGALSVLEQRLPDGYGTPIHVHEREDQTIHLLSGRVVAWLDPNGDDEREVVVDEGETLFLPRGVSHAFTADAPGTVLLEINTPGGFEGFHIDAGEPAPAERLPDPAPPDIENLIRAIADYGATILGPPRV